MFKITDGVKAKLNFDRTFFSSGVRSNAKTDGSPNVPESQVRYALSLITAISRGPGRRMINANDLAQDIFIIIIILIFIEFFRFCGSPERRLGSIER